HDALPICGDDIGRTGNWKGERGNGALERRRCGDHAWLRKSFRRRGYDVTDRRPGDATDRRGVLRTMARLAALAAVTLTLATTLPAQAPTGAALRDSAR